jgi:hypothetical protein
MTHKNKLDIPSIDSLKLSFALDEVDIINQSLLDHKIKQTVNTITGEVEEETPIQQNSLKYQYEGYQIHFAINKLFNQERLVILLNSKMLESNYMDGISMANIEAVYHKLIEADIFHISFEGFLSKGMVSDIDIKKDYEIKTVEQFSQATKRLEQSTVSQKRKDKGVSRFDKKDNKGIEWNNRTTSTYKYPFLKIYHKGLESKHSKNFNFFSQYLDLDSLKNVIRIEGTIKNFSTQGEKYGIKDNSLISLLNLTHKDLNAILNHSLNSNLEKRIKRQQQRTMNEYSPTDMVFFRSLSYGVQKGDSIEQLITYLIEGIPSVQKSRMKKRLIEIYESEIEGTIYAEKSKTINSFFDFIGWE